MGSGGLDSEPFEQITFLNGIFMARVIDEGMKAQLSKKQGFFLKYFPARIRNVGEDAKEDRKLIYALQRSEWKVDSLSA